MEEVTVRSSLLSSDVAKLLAVIMRDVRIKKDIPVGSQYKNLKGQKHLDFRNAKVPPVIITFVQVNAKHQIQ